MILIYRASSLLFLLSGQATFKYFYCRWCSKRRTQNTRCACQNSCLASYKGQGKFSYPSVLCSFAVSNSHLVCGCKGGVSQTEPLIECIRSFPIFMSYLFALSYYLLQTTFLSIVATTKSEISNLIFSLEFVSRLYQLCQSAYLLFHIRHIICILTCATATATCSFGMKQKILFSCLKRRKMEVSYFMASAILQCG